MQSKNIKKINYLMNTKINTKWFGLYTFSFRVIHLRNQLPDHIKYEASVKGFNHKLVINWEEICCSCAICRF